MKKPNVSRIFGAPVVEEVPIPKAVDPAYPEPEPADIDWEVVKSLLDRGWKSLFDVMMELAGVSGRGVHRLNDPTRAGDGASITIETPMGVVTVRTAADGAGSLVVTLPEPPPEPEYVPQQEPEPEPVSSHQEGGYYANAWAEPVVVTNGEQSVRCWDFASTDPEAVVPPEHASGEE